MLAFLYGDVGFSQQKIAKLLGTSIAAVEQCYRSSWLMVDCSGWLMDIVLLTGGAHGRDGRPIARLSVPECSGVSRVRTLRVPAAPPLTHPARSGGVRVRAMGGRSRRRGLRAPDEDGHQPACAKSASKPQSSVTRNKQAVKKDGLKALRPAFGEYNRDALARFIGLCRPEVKGWFPSVSPERLWVETRDLLRRTVPSILSDRATALEAFLDDLPHLLKAAEGRLTRPRLELLHGEFGLDKKTIARLLDAAPPFVAKAIAETRVLRGEGSYLRLTSEGYGRLAQALGRPAWPFEYRVKDGLERTVRRQMLAARDGFCKMAVWGHVDWSAVDRFLTSESARRSAKG